ncbi:MAG: SlyX family protein [Pirellulales bacterium]|nr:SlyX family protein [Pirellulales bacterium]
MDRAEFPEASDISARLTALEERLSFQQRVVDQLHEVLLEQGRRIEALQREAARQRAAVQRLSAAEGDLPHEKPPHY